MTFIPTTVKAKRGNIINLAKVALLFCGFLYPLAPCYFGLDINDINDINGTVVFTLERLGVMTVLN